jgi:sterol desaturase/sphingolipid hydroxylase (fatty acid hydroxylase superfamily)
MDMPIRLAAFLVVFVVVAAAEVMWPRRTQLFAKSRRWLHNIGIAFLNSVLVRLCLPITLAGFAVWVGERHWGILSFTDFSLFSKILVSLILLDLVIYGQHVAFHHIPVLWRLHRVHHADTQIDVTTALRFHPIEIMISMGIKFAAVAAIGAPVEAVLLFEVILNACALFNHGNIRLPAGMDSLLRSILVTPDMHRVHHSAIMQETNSNYGFSISLWDRLFQTYRAQPEHGHEGMMIGLQEFREPAEAKIDRLLTQPFR